MPILLAAAMTLACTPRDVAAATGGPAGDFNGMSHGGTYLILRHRGARACTLPGLPVVSLRDARGRTIAAVRQVPPRTRPGPAVPQMTLLPGARLATGLRWVSGPVFGRSRCHDAASAEIAVGGGTVRAPLVAHLCGPAGRPATFEQMPLGPPPA